MEEQKFLLNSLRVMGFGEDPTSPPMHIGFGFEFGLNPLCEEGKYLKGCPRELQVIGNGGGEGGVVACKSACEAFGLDQYCCSGEFANPTTCKPSFYSVLFKRACPRAYSYAFDDGTSTFTCKAPEYAIIFCPNSGVRRPDGISTTTAIGQRQNRNIAGNVSSSTTLLPFPISILVLLFAACFCHT